MKIALIDHEDSFVYNVAQAFSALGADVRCIRYYEPFDRLRQIDPDAIVFSPGPGHPSDRRVTGLARQVLRTWGAERPILGVCLGHQLIAEAAGAAVIHAAAPVHGEVERIRHDGSELYRGVGSPFSAARYHSLVVDRRTLPDPYFVNAWGARQVVMGIRHRGRPTFGVQFHPESYLTPEGPRLLENFLAEVRR